MTENLLPAKRGKTISRMAQFVLNRAVTLLLYVLRRKWYLLFGGILVWMLLQREIDIRLSIIDNKSLPTLAAEEETLLEVNHLQESSILPIQEVGTAIPILQSVDFEEASGTEVEIEAPVETRGKIRFERAVDAKQDQQAKEPLSQKRFSKKQQQIDYVRRFAKVAQVEMRKYGIPASITIAQGLVESQYGTSKLARENKNHFGLKCFDRHCKKGHCTNHSDDSHKDFFLKFNTVWQSYRAHSKLLQKDRYKKLYQFKQTDYEAWAHGLKKAGYATDPKYAYKLIDVIEELQLYRLDYIYD